MNIKDLKKIIKEEVKSAVKEELQDMLTEAVKIASTPDKTETKGPVQENQHLDNMVPSKPSNLFDSNSTLGSILNETRESMVQSNYTDSSNNQTVSKPNFASYTAKSMGMTEKEPGLDLSSLDFAAKAGEIYKRSLEKDKKRKEQN